MRQLLTRFLDDESGATAIEYAIIAGGIGTKLSSTFGSVSTSLK